MSQENYINHVVLVIDESWSMSRYHREVVKVADSQVQYLAQRSQDLDQETRVSVYTFSNTVRCLIYDKDVLRLPSIKDLYQPNGRTALIDATIKSLDDLSKTATLYGDHAFLAFVLTDGIENQSRHRPNDLVSTIGALPDNWTVACLVPDQRSVFETKSFGFPADNIAVWDTTSAAGVVEVGETIKRATETFFVARSNGLRSSRSIFSTGTDAVNSDTVKSSLEPLKPSDYALVSVNQDAPIRDYVQSIGLAYSVGKGFYQLTKTETIQARKQLLIREKKTNKVYSGSAARDLIGLTSSVDVRVKPNDNPEYDVFVQSTSVNRKVLKGTDLIVLT